MKLVKQIFAFAAILMVFATTVATAQVTTGAINGSVHDNNGEPLIGAVVKVTHVPSGTMYYATTLANGRYTVNGVRVGQNFSVEVSFIGFGTQRFENINVTLGAPTILDVSLEEDAQLLSEITIVGQSAFGYGKTGAATNVSNAEIQTLPTISRSINDFTRLTPQSNGLSFAGRDGRYNYITIDGSGFNNSFGLSGQTRNLPGGDAQPISLDAIDQISVNIAPYDIRQSNFTGASINAVTKSGDNVFKGSAYTFQRPGFSAGKKVGDTKYEWDESPKQTYGLSIGAPIIKNKLFIFANAEYEKSDYPSTPWKVSTDGIADSRGYISRAMVSDLESVKSLLSSKYGYDAGGYDWGQFSSENYKILARVDWNINNNHKFTIRYNQVISTNDVLTNATSAPSGIARANNSRIGEYAMAFTNAGYGFENSVRSLTGELNSSFGSKFSNKFLATYTMIRDKRTSPSSVFPFVDIWEGGEPYTSFGYELYTYNNDVKNNTFSIVDNFSAYFGSHTVTVGASYDQQYFGNAYMSFATGYYRYNSLNAFLNDQVPDGYAITYGLNGNTNPYSELSFGMGAFYLQDEWQVLTNLKLTGGIRFELPFYWNDLDRNDAISALRFPVGTSHLTRGASPYSMDVGTWPDQQLLISPRISFNWDVKSDGKYKVRGGTGIFTGRLPFVWFTNQPTNAGTLQFLRVLSGANVPADMRFDPAMNAQITKYPPLFPTTPATTPPSGPVEVAKNFKMPQVWRTNIAADIALPENMVFTLEGIYTKDINAILQQNINEASPDRYFAGSDNRYYYSATSLNRLNSNISNAMVLDNTDKGYQYSITAQLTKRFSHGFSGMMAYTFSRAKDVTNNPGDQASSAWASNVAVGSLNGNDLSWSNFTIPHRIVASVTYEFDWLKVLHSSFSLFYQGGAQGRLSYVYSNDMNGDGNSSDLMYIPKDPSDIIFVDRTGAGRSPQEQSDAFFKFLEQDKYLKKHKGQYAERFGALLPWRNQFDFKFVQDIIYDKKHSRKLQFTLDIMNVANLINSSWGVYKTQITGSYQNAPILTYGGVNANGEPTFYLPTLGTAGVASDYYKESFKDVASYSSTWSMQFGIRVTF